MSSKFISLFKKSWVNIDETPQAWLKAVEICSKREDVCVEDQEKFAELGFTMREVFDKILLQNQNFEKCSLPNFVGQIYDTELYIRYMKGNFLEERQLKILLDTYNELSMDQSLSLENTETTTTLSMTATGPLQRVAAVELEASNSTQSTVDHDLDTIGKLLAPQLGTSTIGSICSSISLQQNGGLTMLKYPENAGYAIIEVNLARFSKVAHLDSNEAWKAYDYRTKIVVQNNLDHIHILATKLIKNITERLRHRDDFKKTVFRKRAAARHSDPDSDEELQQRKKKRNRYSNTFKE